jgi:hypothetical protein
MVDRLAIFASSPIRHVLPQRPYCTFLSLCQPHLPDNIESWHLFPDNEGICSLLNNETYKPKEIISFENDKIMIMMTVCGIWDSTMHVQTHVVE